MSKLITSVGLMSGTSLDGIDVALIRTDGGSVVERGPSATFSYDEKQRDLLRRALTAAEAVTDRGDRQGMLGLAEEALTQWHADAFDRFVVENDLKRSNIGVIGFHGQTVIHRPERGLTVQLGDGPALHKATGVTVVYDLRAADIASGGQGAPLVPVYHQALAAGHGISPIAFVNIGGVANVTYVDGEMLLAFDTGPGNALIDDWMLKHVGQARDEGGAAAALGQADETVIERFLSHPYFEKAVPKSLDRNAFAAIVLDELSLADGASTLVEVTTRTIARAQQHFPRIPERWIICGGGRHNASIMRSLGHHLLDVVLAETCGFNGDAMEAEAWAYLAVRSLKGLPLSYPTTTGVLSACGGGVVVG